MLRRRKRSRLIIGSNTDSAPACKCVLRIGAATPFGNANNAIENGGNSSGKFAFVFVMI